MALILNVERGNIEVIDRKDSAIGDKVSKEDYEAYLENMNEDLLQLKPGVTPTRFVLRKVIPFEAKQTLRSKNMKIENRDEKAEVRVDVNYMVDTVRMALVDIKNPEEVPADQRIAFRRDKDGFASRELINMLDDAGVVQHLFLAHQNATASGSDEDRKN